MTPPSDPADADRVDQPDPPVGDGPPASSAGPVTERDADDTGDIVDEIDDDIVTVDLDADGALTADVAEGESGPSLPDEMMWTPPRRNAFARFGGRMYDTTIGRVIDWMDAPWPAPRIWRTATTFVILLVSSVILLNVVHLNLVLTNNTPTGGDMGAHVMGPVYLRDHLLGSFKLSGWNPYWYNGFPLYRFYMVPPALMIILLNVVLPYGIAFKIVTVIGIITLPFCCWAFGRLARFAFPIPELMALGAVIFLLEDSKDLAILGGTVKSTMAGEFSFSIALSFAMLGLGLFARGLETGKHRAKAAVLIALAILSHGIVAIFVVIAVVLMALVWMDRQRLVYSLTTLVPAALLTAFWIIPFALGGAYMTDMKYEARPNSVNDSYWKMFFNLDVTLDRIVFTLALIGFIAAIVRRHLTGAWMGITIVALAVLCRFTEHEHKNIPLIGLLWNPRVLPFINLLRYLLMMVGIAELGRALTWLAGRARVGAEVARERRAGRTGASVALPTSTFRTVGGVVTTGVTLVTTLLILAVAFEVSFFAGGKVDGRYSLYIGSNNDPLVLYQKRTCEEGKSCRSLADSWARYNFTGYEGKAAYGEYRALVNTMAEIGADPQFGCGRALWENNERNGQYGTTMALMLLPHWTDGCIGSSEGLFFEASGTTPYHFLSTAALSWKSSNPVRELRYTNNDATIGVRYLQELGIRYYMGWTDQAVAEADANPDLTPIATSGPWHIYEVANSDIVEALTVQPVVVDGRADDREEWLELGTSYFQNPSDWTAAPAGGGPSNWQRVDVAVDPGRVEDRKVDVVVPTEPIEVVELPAVTVSNVVMGNETLSFDVDQIGVPVVVKVSYFPNWVVEGGEGPWRIAPNMMVVVPTSTHVSMSFDRSATDYVAYLLTLVGIILLLVFARYVPIRFNSPHPFAAVGGPALAGASSAPVAHTESGAFGEWSDDPPLITESPPADLFAMESDPLAASAQDPTPSNGVELAAAGEDTSAPRDGHPEGGSDGPQGWPGVDEQPR